MLRSVWTATCVGLLLALLLVPPRPVRADGAPIIPDPELWAMVDEGQQVAVIRLEPGGAARIDLFISMIDRSGESHEVVFCVPLGAEAEGFSAAEETSVAFDEALTEPVEAEMRAESAREDEYRTGVQAALLVGALPAHAGWGWLLGGARLLFSLRLGVGAAPIAAFDTASSEIALYAVDEDTDLQALVETAGLDPRVRDTLEGLRGQQVAVVRLRTQPAAPLEEPSTYGEGEGDAGLHLGWRARLVPRAAGAAYRYPLGTGRAWARPIGLTRVYVVAPPALDFQVDYPRLGEELTGHVGQLAGRLAWRWEDVEGPAFAVEESYGTFGHVWRGIYVKSNPAQDVVVTGLERPAPQVQRAIRRAQARGVLGAASWPAGLLAGAAAWVTAWRAVMPRRMGVPYRWREGRLYRDALAWAGAYILLCAVVVGLAAFPLLQDRAGGVCGVGVLLAGGLVLVPVTLGLGSALLFARARARALDVSRGRAAGAYLLTVLAANALYMGFALAYGLAVGGF